MITKSFSIPYGKSFQKVRIPEKNIAGYMVSGEVRTTLSEQDEVKRALENPIGSPALAELAKNAKRVLFITNDMTRPMPSKITIPAIIEEIKKYNSNAAITILIASGLHRAMTRRELINKMGDAIVNKYNIVVHDAYNKDQLVYRGKLASGNPLRLNKAITEHDLIVSEGFIEPHWLGGFSGGRKSILPGAKLYEVWQKRNVLLRI